MRRSPLLIFIFSIWLSALVAQTEYKYIVDISNIKDDKLFVKLIPPKIPTGDVAFRFPAIVPGTYAIYDFGRFISGFSVYNKKGEKIPCLSKDVNTYTFVNNDSISYISYTVEDTWDSSQGEPIIFEPAGTNFEAGKNIVLNNHGLFGYFEHYLHLPYRLEITRPENFYPSTGLSSIVSNKSVDQITASSYYELSDSPIMYCIPDTTTLLVGDTKVLVSVFSPQHKTQSKFIASNIEAVLNAQKEYLGGELPVQKYAFLVYLTEQRTLSGSTGALEHSYSSFYVLPEMDSLSMAQNMRDVAAHEFFHIVTPLNIHSKEIGEFDYNNPKMSQHLWFYEGLTEYAASHVQVKSGLMEIDHYFEVLKSKMEEALANYDDTLAFTQLSKYVLDKYHKQYTNVYAKGALIGLCLDIQLRYYSSGKYGTQDLVMDLSKKFGKNVSFDDDQFFAEIEKLTYPEIRQFLEEYVGGNKPLPFEKVFDMVGLFYKKEEKKSTYTLGGFGIGYNPHTNRAVIFDVAMMDDFGKSMGFKDGDEILEFNGVPVTLDNLKEEIYKHFNRVKLGDKLKVQVLRKSKRGKLKKKTLKASCFPVDVTLHHHITVNQNAGKKQILARNGWLGLR